MKRTERKASNRLALFMAAIFIMAVVIAIVYLFLGPPANLAPPRPVAALTACERNHPHRC